MAYALRRQALRSIHLEPATPGAYARLGRVAAPRLVDESVVYVDGPWTHRAISANGIRFHAAEMGSGPLVLLLHGFPEFWWSWRRQLVALAGAGYRAVAPDLRGYGASDKPPRGYDLPTLAADVAGIVRGLGERSAVVVGHDWGAALGWTAAVLHRPAVRRLVAVGVPHPLRLRSAVLGGARGQPRASRYMAAFQLPWQPERWLVADDAAAVGRLLRAWGGPGFPDEETERRCRQAMRILYAPARALEYYRWMFRSQLRTDGHRFARAIAAPVNAPTLQLHGDLDRCVLPGAAQGSGRYVSADYEWRLLPGVGHFPHEEVPEAFNTELLSWLASAEAEK
jgi:pimeloyl-ACP methyl ester carboxylesterase